MAPEHKFLRVGITGGIGTGKSTVCELFSDLGRHVILADNVARQIVDTNNGVKRSIAREFGSSIYLPNGTLDRKRMASIVFSDDTRRKKLDAIVHPHVFQAVELQVESLPSKQAYPYVLIEAALIFETGMHELLDHVIVVTAEEEHCIQRVIARDHTTREEVLRRIAAQMPIAKKVQQADFVIQNNGPASGLRSTVMFLDNLLSQILTSHAL
jgi:dephospho-CoA kinase